MMGIFIPVNSFLLEHWLYLPSIGFFLMVSYLLNIFFKKNIRVLLSLVTLIAIVLSFLTFNRNKDWRDPITFYNNIIDYTEGTSRVHNNLAMAYSAKNKYELAIKHYLKAIEIKDSYPQTHYNLARV